MVELFLIAKNDAMKSPVPSLRPVVLVFACLLSGFPSLLRGEEKVSFSRQVLPILSNKCFVCHGPDSHDDTELRLDSEKGAHADLGGYQAVHPESPEKSELLKRVLSKEDPMPPLDAEKQLTPDEKKILSRWIAEGGTYTRHWAYVVPKKSKPESATGPSGSEQIDGFIGDLLIRQKIGHAPTASAEILARRAALVLTGLPPAPELLNRFLKDKADDAFGRYVDRLLADKKYGEHQARYWLDAVRYGDTHGLHLDNKRGIYPYRDWVVRAFNRNLPFDQFITWQLAGDLLPQPTLEQQVATGFVRMNPSTAEGGAIPAEFQAKNNFDRTENLGTVFLGMSLVCARCHTHKYDPIPQSEYYRLMAFFNSTAEPSMDGNRYIYGPIVKAPDNQEQWARLDSLNQRAGALLEQANTFLSRVRLGAGPDVEAWKKSAGNRREQLRLIAKPLGFFKDQAFGPTAAAWVREYEELEKGFTTTLVAKELAKPRVTRVLHRGEYNQPTGDPLQPGVISVANPLPRNAPPNRLGLAQWITSPENPLTSRVLVNRIWQRVFGDALVRTPEDFGLQGEQPTHPKLLDWLAVEFRESGWDLKKLIKMMVMTKTFQQESSWRTDVDDPENRLFARGPSYRLDAEVLRDIALWGSGLMADERGGEGVKPYQPPGMWKALAHPGSNTKNYVADKGEKLYRRSLYVYWKRTSPHPMMTLFDAPSRESSCVRRSRTNTSLQSLGLFNETQRIELSRKFAERLVREKTDGQRLEWLYRLVVCRPPNEVEKEVLGTYRQKVLKRYRSSEKDALDLLSIGDAPRDEKLDPAEVAAWTQVVVTVLASDAALLLY
ncbi:MAG: PSD1 and planctomycete cytochrome C domain-containing protein [Planctomycetota bacterium]|nr:PSD1 and planctomycete cytochrome C domain-containing protein [Planctomycetota bacterium]